MSRWVGAALCLELALAGAAWGLAGRHRPGPGTVDGYLGRQVSLVGTVASVSASAFGGGRLRLEVTGLAPTGGRVDAAGPGADAAAAVDGAAAAGGAYRRVAGAVLVEAAVPVALEAGDLVTARGRLSALRRIGPSGQEGYDERLQRDGVFAALPGASVEVVAPGTPSLPGRLHRIRAALLDAVDLRFPEPEAAVLGGLLLGARGHLPAAVDRDLQDSGLIHLLAISGLKVAIVAGCLEAVLVRLLGRRGAAVSLLGTAAYVAVAGASGLRAALMGGLATAGRALGRDVDPMRSLLLAAAAMLAWRPSLCADLAFQFSFLGVLGIHLLGVPLLGALPRLLPTAFREALAISLGAQALTLPLTARYFGVIPLLSPLANGMMVPLAPVTMVLGLLATGCDALAGSIPGLAGSATGGLPPGLLGLTGHAALGPPLAVAAGSTAALTLMLIKVLLVVAHVTARLPGVIHVPAFGPAATAAYYAGVGMVLAGRRRRWALAIGLPAAAAAAMAVLALASHPDGRLHLAFLPVGGPAVLVRAPDGATLVVDGGSSAAALPAALDAELPPGAPPPGLGRGLDAVLLTGSSRPEAGAAPALARYRLSLLVVPAVDDGDATAIAAEAAAGRGARVLRLAADQRLAWHGLSLRLVTAGPVDLLDLRWGDVRVLIGPGGTPKDPALPPHGRFTAVALGARAPSTLLLPPTNWLVIQDGTARAGGRLPRYVTAGRVWRTAVDGPLDLVCDPRGCESP